MEFERNKNALASKNWFLISSFSRNTDFSPISEVQFAGCVP